VRNLCLALPEAHEVEAWGEPTFRVKNKLFAMYASAGNHHGGGRPAVWLKATREDQARLIGAMPEQFFSPPYVGKSGWIGIWLDKSPDWDEVDEFVREAYRLIAPRRLTERLDKSS
jgi:predicted DNA-binding protein (MmcQ/YjbR family)